MERGRARETMSSVLDELSGPERRGFARLLAEEMRPFIQEAIHAFMGQDGEAHKKDHVNLREFLDTMNADRKRRQELTDKVKVHVIGWGIVAALSGAGYLILHWLKP